MQTTAERADAAGLPLTEVFVNRGWVLVPGAVEPEIAADALTYLKTLADPEAVDGRHPALLACMTQTVRDAIGAITGPELGMRFVLSDYHARAFDRDAVWRFQRLHVDDDYPTLLPNDWVLGCFVFLNDVPSRGGAFVHVDGSYARLRALLARTPDALYGEPDMETVGLPENGTEYLAKCGDVILFHHLHAHCGTNNVAVPDYVRHALLFRIYCERRVEPGQKPVARMMPIERANSCAAGGVSDPGGIRQPGNGPDRLRDGISLQIAVESYAIAHIGGETRLFLAGAGDREAITLWSGAELGNWTQIARIDPGVGPLQSVNVVHAGPQTWLAACGTGGQGRLLASGDLRNWRTAYEFSGAACAQFTVGKPGEASASIFGSILMRLARDGGAIHATWSGDEAGSATARGPAEVLDCRGLPFAPREFFFAPVTAEWFFGVVLDGAPSGRGSLIARAPDIAKLSSGDFAALRDERGEPVARLRPLARAQDFWLAAYLIRGEGGDRLHFASLDWTDAPGRVSRLADRAGFDAALSRLGLV